MFGQISLTQHQRHLFGASDNKILQSASRCLRVVLFPRVLSLVLLCLLYSVAEYEFTHWYFGVYGFVWKPAFPWSWRLLFLLSCAVPAFSFLHIVWLLALAYQRWRRRHDSPSGLSEEYTMLQRSESDSLEEEEERELSGAGDDEDCDEADIEGSAGSSRLHPPFPRQPPRALALLTSDWFMQFIIFLTVLCTSLWVGLHYRHPGDLRYLPLIENADAHPNRAGYANQGRCYRPRPSLRSISLTDPCRKDIRCRNVLQ